MPKLSTTVITKAVIDRAKPGEKTYEIRDAELRGESNTLRNLADLPFEAVIAFFEPEREMEEEDDGRESI